jgi:hypothetical protein
VSRVARCLASIPTAILLLFELGAAQGGNPDPVATPVQAALPAQQVGARPQNPLRPREAPAAIAAADARPLLQSDDALVRGEAALVVAMAQDDGDYQAILDVARDRHRVTRLRGILALGLLGVPGAEVELQRILRAHATRPSPDSKVAAYALARLPAEIGGSSVTTYLQSFQGLSMSRHRDVLLAMLHGTSPTALVGQQDALSQLFHNASIRDSAVRAALLRLLVLTPQQVDDQALTDLLSYGTEIEQLAALRALQSARETPTSQQAEQIVQLAKKAASPRLRAEALATLTRHRHPQSLAIAQLASEPASREEADQKVRTIMALGGHGMTASLLDGFAEFPPTTQAAALRNWGRPLPEDVQATCLTLVVDRDQPLLLRTEAGLALAHAGHRSSAPVLRDLFCENEDSSSLYSLALAILQTHPNPPACDRLLPPGKASLGEAPLHLLALLRAGHPQTRLDCSRILRAQDTDTATLAVWLHALRSSCSWPATTDLLQPLPAPLDELL